MKNDLSIITTEEILGELKERFKDFVFIALLETKADHSEEEITRLWYGSSMTCYGLLENMRSLVRKAVIEFG